MKQYLTTENIITASLIANIVLFIAAVYFYKMYRFYKKKSKELNETLYENLKSFSLREQTIRRQNKLNF